MIYSLNLFNWIFLIIHWNFFVKLIQNKITIRRTTSVYPKFHLSNNKSQIFQWKVHENHRCSPGIYSRSNFIPTLISYIGIVVILRAPLSTTSLKGTLTATFFCQRPLEYKLFWNCAIFRKWIKHTLLFEFV